MWKGFIKNVKSGTFGGGNNITSEDVLVVEKPDKEISYFEFTGTDTKTLTVYFTDGSSLSGNFNDKDTTSTDNYLSAINVNSQTGDITFQRTGGLQDIVLNLDNRYVTSIPVSDNYQSWGLQVNSGVTLDVSSQDIINLIAGNNVTITRNGLNITIDATTGIASYSFNIQVNGGTSTQIDDGETINFEAGSNVTLSRTGNTINISAQTGSNYTNWNVRVNEGATTSIDNGEILTFKEGSNVTLSRVGNEITIASTATGTVIEGTINVTSSITLNNSHNQKTLLCRNTSDITITVPTGLGTDFTCNFVAVNTGSRIVNIIGGSGFNLIAPHGNKLLTDYTANIIKTTGQEEGNLQGELTP